ncbi:undecaprenyl-phosphate glucose phosphotransferase [Emticicia sp. SJ17W-69]|uniref:undecaprenyl-phosphate glucose phosphotransferase n=1 Tax=Emticicia sp. SJ17W-69 TaxID=3421657 RepID=UPI003EBEC00F
MKAILSKNRHKRQFFDIAILGISFYFAMIISQKEITNHQLLIPVVLSFIWYFTSKYTNLYDDFRTTSFVSEILVLMPNILFQLFAVGFIYFAINDHEAVRTLAIVYICMLTVSLILKKYILKQWKLYNWISGNDLKNLLIVGSGEQGMAFYQTAKNSKQFGYNPIGFIEDFQPEKLNGKFRGKTEDIENVIINYNVDEMIISLSQYEPEKIKKLLAIADKYAVRTKIIPEYFQFYSSKFKMDIFGHLPIITVREEPLEEFHLYMIKNISDIIFTSILFVFVFSWLFPIIALAIKLDSKGPVFYIQERWGKNGKAFKCIKFRSMVHNSSTVRENGKFNQTTKNDSRVTRVGAFLRKSNFDELPQFINVLWGNMSVIGPRPHAVQHSIESREQIENYLLRHLVKPGITGWAQVNGYRGETSDIFMMKKRVELDIWYIENWTPWLDIKVIIMTVYSMIKGDMMAY